MRSNRPNGRERFDAEQIARAKYFTACQFLGRGQYDRRECPTLEAARETGRAMKAENEANGRGVMIYAVTPEGWTIHVENV